MYVDSKTGVQSSVLLAIGLKLYKCKGRGGISGLGSSGGVGKFHPKWSKFGTFVHLGSKT